MRIGFLADVHLANHRKFAKPTQGKVAPLNTRAADTVRVLSMARAQAEREGCTDLFVLGDVFDTTTPEPALVAEFQQAMSSPVGMQIHLMLGNHDQQSPARGDHALVSLDGFRSIHVHTEAGEVYTQDGEPVFLVPYRPGRADEYLPEAVGKTEARTLGLHLGLRDDDTPKWLQQSHDSYPVNRLAEVGSFGLVAAGNWHLRKEYPMNVWQIGAIVPTGFDNPGLTGYGTLLRWDGRVAVPIEMDGPRFVRAQTKTLKATLETIQDRVSGFPTYLSVKCAVAEREDVRELLDVYAFTNYELLTDKDTAETMAREAAGAAAYASTDSIHAAVRAYVERMALPNEVDRAKVTELALGYISGASQ